MRAYYLSVIDGTRKGIDAACLRVILRGFSLLYCIAVMMVRCAYRIGFFKAYDLGFPVISIGNITWGGAGKTPLVEWLVKDLLALGQKPVVLTRGYMSGARGCCQKNQSDEVELLRRAFDGKVPVIANKSRVQGALMVPADYARDVFVLDDGFQHWQVKRDLNIVVIDALDPFGHGAMIPRGSLREPVSALKYADVCVISRSDLAPEAVAGIRKKITAVAPGMRFAEAVHRPKIFLELKTGDAHALSYVQNRPVVLLSGIGSPRGFERTVQSLGADVKHHMIYPDHYCYQSLDIQQVLSCMEKYGVCDVITTAKDAVKLNMFLKEFLQKRKVLSLLIDMDIVNGEEVLKDAIVSVIHA